MIARFLEPSIGTMTPWLMWIRDQLAFDVDKRNQIEKNVILKFLKFSKFPEEMMGKMAEAFFEHA